MNRRMFFVIISLALLDSMGMSLVYPLFSTMLFHKEWQFVDPSTSETMRGLWLGLLLSATQITQVLFSPSVGKLSDKHGRKPIILCCAFAKLLGYVVATISVAYGSLIGLLSSRILLGFSSCEYPVLHAAIADISDLETKRQRFVQTNMVFGLGFAIGPFFGGALLAYGFLFLPFLASLLLSLLDGLLVIAWFRETKGPHSEQQDPSPFWKAFNGIRDIHPLLIFILLASFLYCFGWSFYLEIIPTWWISGLGISAQEVGRLMAYGGLSYAIGCGFIVGPIVRMVPPTRILQWALMMLAVCIWAVVFFSENIATFWILIPLHNLLGACLFPVCAMVVSDMAPSHQQGKVMGLHASAEGMGFSLSPIISGLSLGLHPLMPVYLGGLSIFIAGWLVVVTRRMRLSHDSLDYQNKNGANDEGFNGCLTSEENK